MAGVSIRVQESLWPSSSFHSDLVFGVLIGLIVAVALLLRWAGLGSQSLWLDEGITFWISRFAPRDIWHILWLDTSNPLYYVLLHYWSNCFGVSEVSLRALSALFATLSIPLFYGIAHKIIVDRTFVALAMILYALSFYQVWYAQEARCYALLVLLSLGSVYWLLLCLENITPVRLCTFALFLAASLYTHNITLFYLPGLAIMWLVYPAEKTFRMRVRDGFVVASLVALLYIPWVPHLLGHMQRIHRGWWVAIPRIQDLLSSLCVLSGFDTHTLQDIFRDRFHALWLFGFWTWAPAVLLMFIICIFSGLGTGRSDDRRKVLALLAYSLTPVLLVFIDSRLSNPIYLNRVFLGSCAVFPMLFSAPIAFQPISRRRVFQFVALLAVLGAAVSTFGYLKRERREDWRGMTGSLVNFPRERRLSVIVPDIAQVLVQYYTPGTAKSYVATSMTGLLTAFDPPDVGLEQRILELNDDPNTEVLALLSRAMASGIYREIDVAGMPVSVTPTLQYLSAHCASVERVEFHWLEVRRCFLGDGDHDTRHRSTGM